MLTYTTETERDRLWFSRLLQHPAR